jgi:dipicolinate synthase subunit B
MDNSEFDGKTIGFALTGSFCNLEIVVPQMARLRQAGAKILPILSYNMRDMDSRFGTAAYWRSRIIEAAQTENIIDTIPAAEPVGPQHLCDILIIAPCTGNTVAKLACGIIDTPVMMAAKSHLRNGCPLVLAVSSNDGLGANAKNIGLLLNVRNIFFVPFGQDNPSGKSTSLTAAMELIPETLGAALGGRQYQPILTCSVAI